MPQEIIAVLALLKDYGSLGTWALIAFLFWKLFTNHLHHMDMKLDDIGKDVKALGKATKEDSEELNKKIDETHKKAEALGERIAKIEGQVEQ